MVVIAEVGVAVLEGGLAVVALAIAAEGRDGDGFDGGGGGGLLLLLQRRWIWCRWWWL